MKKAELPPFPVRVVCNKNGNATTPELAMREHRIRPDIVFVRKDGWALGAPYRFADVAYSLWANEWTIYYDLNVGRDFTLRADLYPKFRARAKERKSDQK